jgi:hypothetical protein
MVDLRNQIAVLGIRSNVEFPIQPPALDTLSGVLSLQYMQTGIIAALREGFGFIKIEGAEKDLFFHANELENVRFDDLRSRRRP